VIPGKIYSPRTFEGATELGQKKKELTKSASLSTELRVQRKSVIETWGALGLKTLRNPHDVNRNMTPKAATLKRPSTPANGKKVKFSSLVTERRYIKHLPPKTETLADFKRKAEIRAQIDEKADIRDAEAIEHFFGILESAENTFLNSRTEKNGSRQSVGRSIEVLIKGLQYLMESCNDRVLRAWYRGVLDCFKSALSICYETNDGGAFKSLLDTLKNACIGDSTRQLTTSFVERAEHRCSEEFISRYILATLNDFVASNVDEEHVATIADELTDSLQDMADMAATPALYAHYGRQLALYGGAIASATTSRDLEERLACLGDFIALTDAEELMEIAGMLLTECDDETSCSGMLMSCFEMTESEAEAIDAADRSKDTKSFDACLEKIVNRALVFEGDFALREYSRRLDTELDAIRSKLMQATQDGLSPKKLSALMGKGLRHLQTKVEAMEKYVPADIYRRFFLGFYQHYKALATATGYGDVQAFCDELQGMPASCITSKAFGKDAVESAVVRLLERCKDGESEQVDKMMKGLSMLAGARLPRPARFDVEYVVCGKYDADAVKIRLNYLINKIFEKQKKL